jgi:putative ABC transport system permease protein
MATLKLAFRTLFKSPLVAVVAIASLALGIGANAAIFSLFDQMLLRAIPVSHPDRLVNLAAPGPKNGSTSCSMPGGCEAVFSYPMFRDLERRTGSAFSGVAAHMPFDANIAFNRQTQNGPALFISGAYFPVLGLAPTIGRLIGPSDDQDVGAHYVAVLGYSYWATQLGGDSSVVGQVVTVNGRSMTIIGVAPRGFEGTTLGSRPRVYVPITMRAVMQPWFNGFDNRQSYWAYLFARLKPGVTIGQARTGANAVYRPIINDVEASLQKGMSAAAMTRFRAKEVVVENGRRGQSSMLARSKAPLLFLFSIGGIVLLIACANVANLLLARGVSRSLEMAVRLSLGATRPQLLRQLLTESCVLAALAGCVSLLVAYWTLGLLRTVLPAEAASTLPFTMNLTAVLFAGVLSLATGLLFGLYPALNSTRPDLVTSLRNNSGKQSGTRGAIRFRTTLATAQIALSMALLISAGLFVKSLRNVSRIDLGLQLDNVVTFGISPELNGYEPERTKVLFARVEEELSALPGVTGVAAARVPLLAGNNWGNNVSVEGFKKRPDVDDNARFNEVGPGYLHVVGVPLLAGREFRIGDAMGAPKVAIVNETFAKKFNLGRSAVGKRMSLGEHDVLDIEIVGLARDAKYSEVKDEIPPLFILPYRQSKGIGSAYFYVNTAGLPMQTLRAIPGVIKKLDPNLPVEELKTMPQQVRDNVFMDRMVSSLTASFALLATMLAAVGLYGVLAYSVSLRTKEIGVRMALGADAGRVMKMVLRQVGVMTLVGGAIGIACALALGHAARSLLFQLESYDPMTVVLGATMLAAVALAAGLIPARRASRVDPIQALRHE